MSDDSHAKVLDALNSLGVDYEVMPCDPDLADTEIFCAHYDIPRNCSANTIIVKSKTGERRYVACVLLATTLDWMLTVRYARRWVYVVFPLRCR